jgi:hypothetical protein
VPASSASAATSHCRVICHLTRRTRHRNHCPIIIPPPKEQRRADRNDTNGTARQHACPIAGRQTARTSPQAEGYAYALAHGYDIGGQTERAYGLVALGERIRDTATDVSDLARPVEPHSVGPALGLSLRAFSLRRLLRRTAWQGPSAVPLVPRLAAEGTERVSLREGHLEAKALPPKPVDVCSKNV